MKTKVKALTSFVHGRMHVTPDDDAFEVSKGEADELQKAGLVQLADEQEEATQPAAQDAEADDVTDILGDDADGKMEDAPRNKMDAAPDNKGAGKKTTVKKAD